MKHKTFLVGGAVRDKVLGVKPKDLDFVVCAPSFEAMEKQLIEEGAKIFVSKPEYLTIRCNHPVFGSADFACARRDGCYSDGRRPDDTFVTQSLEEDLSRRDFSIGAMAIDMDTHNMIDPHDGIGDCRRKIIRCVGEPTVRFTEDALRIFRAIRFAVTKGFTIEDKTAKAMRELSCNYIWFKNVSTERIREELLKAFAADTWHTLSLLDDFELTGILAERQIWLKPTTEKA